MKITKQTFEGTVEEFRAAHSLLNFDLQDAGKQAMPDQPSPTSSPLAFPNVDANEELTYEVAEVFLTRRPLTKNQKNVLKNVLNAGAPGITSSEIAQNIGCEPEKLQAFVRKWEGSENRYRLHPAVRAVLQSGHIVL
jgi:hypothetical protein